MTTPNIGVRTLNPAYQEVEDVFRKNFADGWEKQGAAFAAYVNGELVVDVWGGYADASCGWKWREDTKAVIFSCTKSLCAICVTALVDQGLLSYDDPVCKYWPEYAQHGKEKTTILNVLHHQAGMPYFTNADGSVIVLDIDHVTDMETMEKIVEQQRPHYEPGTESGYHGLTYSFLLNGIFRRVDPLKRTVGEYFDQQIASKYDLDLHIGWKGDKEDPVARITNISDYLVNILREVCYDPMIAVIGIRQILPCSSVFRVLENFYGIGNDMNLYNNPEMRKIGLPAVNGVGTARSLAKALDLFARGEIVSKNFIEDHLLYPVIDEIDATCAIRMIKGHGFLYTKSPLGDWQYGHFGMGGQNVKTDPKTGITLAYLTNGMKIECIVKERSMVAGQGENTRTVRLLESALYKCYKQNEKEENKKTDCETSKLI